jgi:hypothetical protein
MSYQETFIKFFELKPRQTFNQLIDLINEYSIDNEYEILQHQVLINYNSYITGITIVFKIY